MTVSPQESDRATTRANAQTKARPIRRLGLLLRNVLVTVGALCVLCIAALALAAAHLNDYRADVESAVSEMLGHRITIGAVEASWEGFAPVLRLRDVALYSAKAGREGFPLKLARAEIALDPIATARARTLRSRRVRIVGATLTLAKDARGQVTLAGFGHNRGGARTNTPPEPTTRWQALALGQRDLELLRTEVRWLGSDRASAPTTLGELNARIRNEANHHYVSASVMPDGSSDHPLRLRADVAGSLATSQWSATVSVAAEQLDLSNISSLVRHFQPTDADPAAELRGAAEVDLVMEVGPQGLKRLDGALSAVRPGVRFARATGTGGPSAGEQYLELERIDLEGALTRISGGWLAQTSRLKLVSRHGVWPTENASVRVVAESDRARRFELSGDRVRLEHVRTLLDSVLTRPALKHVLETAAPKGEFRNFAVTVALLDGVVRMRGFTGEVVGLETRGVRMIPGVVGLHGRVDATAEGGRFTISQGPSEFTLPSFYSGPRKVDAATGTLAWTLGTEGGTAWSDDLSIRSDGVEATLAGAGLWQTDAQSPFVSTSVTLSPGDVPSVARMLLIKKLPGTFRSWFSGAVKGGTVERVTIATRGYVHALPFGSGPNGFELTADVRGADFAYAPGWPQAKDVSARIRVRGRGMEAKVRAARIFGSTSKRFAVVVPNLTARPLRLDMQGAIAGDSSDALRFVRESVLESRLGHQLSEVSASGRCEITLNMALEVPTGRPKRLAGKVQLYDNRLVTTIGPVLEAANGTLEFDLEGLRLRGAKARYLGAAVTVATGPAPHHDATVIEMKGTADGPLLERLAATSGLPEAKFLDTIVSGRSTWQASLQIPKHPGAGPRLLRVRSPLTGMDLDLPGALGKRAAQTRPLEVVLVYDHDDQRELRVSYGPNWNGVFALAREGEGWTVERGHLRVGGELAHLPAQPGIVVDGRLRTLHFDSWNRAFSGPDSFISEPSSWAQQIRSIELEVDDVRAFDQRFKIGRVLAAHSKRGWDIRIFGEEAAGRIVFPNAPAGPDAPLVLRFDRLKLKRAEGKAPYSGRAPGELPPIDAYVRSLQMDDLTLGQVSFQARPAASGLQISGLRVVSEAFSVNGDGVWAYENGRHTTELNFRVHAEAIGGLLKALGQDNTAIEGGNTDILVDAMWSGAPSAFDLGIINGSIHVRSKKGQLLDIQPGLTGRAFGLLSLAALPRHLRMDFSHVFGQGFSFDTIEGSFHLEDGNAYTNDLQMIGPSARVDLAGRAGLVARDYDQLVTVTPRLTSSIPLAPLWLAEKMLQTNIFNRVFASRYALTGSWEDPVVERIVEPDTEVHN